MNSSVLFITYDGLLDPLGGSQILPYLYKISQHPRKVHILSFEKQERFAEGAAQLRAQLVQRGIEWKPLSFTRRFGKLGKLWDLARLYYWGTWLTYKHKVRVVHARGHPTAQIGLFVKRLMGTRLIFDCRGLWVDERVDKGGWDMNRWLHRLQYQHFKNIERKLFLHADQVVVLTHKVVPEVVKLGAVPVSKVSVIPCCADFDHFPLSTPLRTAQAKDMAGIPQATRVLGYLGSVGPMYMLGQFFRFFQLACSSYDDCHALIITQDVDALREVMRISLPAALESRVHIKRASRTEVPDILPAIGALVSFIQPSFARMSMSPTKLAECFAEGIPVICNDGVGDVVMLVDQLNAGVIVNPASDIDLSMIAQNLDEVFKLGGQRLRDAAQPLLGLEVADVRYRSVYSRVD
jgi:glycosyltransferase involved in cell wall biosynthesis